MGRSYLFSGSSGVGKKKSALALAQFLLCENYPQVCGVCPSCNRAEKMAHESLLVVEPTQGQIRMDEARKILDFLSFQSLTRFRVIVIDEVHRMNAAAANSLLKILEEPPANTFFFLISSSPSAVLSTLRSRSLKVPFKPVPLEEMEKAVQAPAWALKASRGRFDLLLQKTEDEDREQVSFWAAELLRTLAEPDLLADPKWRESFKDREVFGQRLKVWMELLRDALVLKHGGQDSVIHSDLPVILEQLMKQSSDQLLKAFGILLGFERDLVFNRDSVLMTEEFIVEMKS